MAVHCYGACRPDIAAPEGPGVAAQDVEVLADGPVAVLASSVPDGAGQPDRAALAAHARVVEQAFQRGVVVPLRFPTVVPSAFTAVTKLLRPRRAALVDALDRLDGEEEARVRVSYDEDAAVAEVLENNPRLSALRGRPEAALRLGEAIVAALRDRAARDAEAVLASLRRIVDDVVIDETAGVQQALTASVLVRRGDTDRVREAVSAWAATRSTVQARVSGPLPPYSFARLNERG